MEKVLEVLVGPKWTPVALFIPYMLIPVMFIALALYCSYRLHGKQNTIHILFCLAGLMLIDIKSTQWLLSAISCIVGMGLLIFTGMVKGARLPKHDRERLLAGLEE